MTFGGSSAMTVSKETVELLPHAGHNPPAIAKQESVVVSTWQ